MVPTHKDMKFTILISYLECYNERIYDLLRTPTNGRRTPLSIKEDKNKHIFIKDLLEQPIKNVEQAMKWLEIGLKNRKVGQTYINRDSSRSHSIFTIKLAQIPKNVSIEEVRKNPSLMVYSKFSIVDLAGSERSSKSRAEGNRIKEAGNINNSLMILGKCLEIMRQNQYWEGKEGSESKIKMVPFRESKLTRLFQDFFLGNGGKAVMIVNVSTNPSDYDQTTQALSFATTAKHVVPTIRKQQTSTKVDKDEIQPIPFMLGGEETKKENKENIKPKLITKEKDFKKILKKKPKEGDNKKKEEENVVVEEEEFIEMKEEKPSELLEEDNEETNIIKDNNDENNMIIEEEINKECEIEKEDTINESFIEDVKIETSNITDEYNHDVQESTLEDVPTLMEIYNDNDGEETYISPKKSILTSESTPSKKVSPYYESPYLRQYNSLDLEFVIRSDIAEEHAQNLSEIQQYYHNHYEDKMSTIIELMNQKLKNQEKDMNEYIQFQEEKFLYEIKMRDDMMNELNQRLEKEIEERAQLKANLEKKDEIIDALKIKYQKKITKFKEDIFKLNDEYKRQLEATKRETESLKKLIKEQKVEEEDEEVEKRTSSSSKKRKSSSISEIESETEDRQETYEEEDCDDIENMENQQIKPKRRGRPRNSLKQKAVRTKNKESSYKKAKTEESEVDDVVSSPKRKLKRLKKMKEVLSPTNGMIPTKTPLRKRLRPRKVNPLAFSQDE